MAWQGRSMDQEINETGLFTEDLLQAASTKKQTKILGSEAVNMDECGPWMCMDQLAKSKLLHK